jgi:hypothetical protein
VRIAVGWLQIGPCVVTAEELGQCSGVTRSGDDREGEGMSYSSFQGEAKRFRKFIPQIVFPSPAEINNAYIARLSEFLKSQRATVLFKMYQLHEIPFLFVYCCITSPRMGCLKMPSRGHFLCPGFGPH